MTVIDERRPSGDCWGVWTAGWYNSVTGHCQHHSCIYPSPLDGHICTSGLLIMLVERFYKLPDPREGSLALLRVEASASATEQLWAPRCVQPNQHPSGNHTGSRACTGTIPLDQTSSLVFTAISSPHGTRSDLPCALRQYEHAPYSNTVNRTVGIRDPQRSAARQAHAIVSPIP